MTLKKIKELKLENYPVCIAKTQYSFSDDPKNLECAEPFDINVSDIIIKNGAEGFFKIELIPREIAVLYSGKMDGARNGNGDAFNALKGEVTKGFF